MHRLHYLHWIRIGIEGVRLEDFKGRIGQVYDDTLQLQLDVLGQNYGLSKES